MYKIEKKKMIIIVILGILTIVSIIKIIDTYFEKNNTKETGILNIISKEETNEETEEKIVIYITGEVLNEGVYELKRGSRIANAIEAAGGTKENANLKNVNLAYELDDGEKIYIPNVNEEETEIVEDGIGEKDEKNKETVININKANSEQLQDLSGIGENTALSIIKYHFP